MEKPVVFMLQEQSALEEPQEQQKRRSKGREQSLETQEGRSKDRKKANDSGTLLNRGERAFIVLLIAFFIAAALLIALVIVFARSLAVQAPLAPPAVVWNLAETSLSIME
jgi:Flp pilus assembly protein TadB